MTRLNLQTRSRAFVVAVAVVLSGCGSREAAIGAAQPPSLVAPATAGGYAVLHKFGRPAPIGGGDHPAGLIAVNGTLYGTAHAGGKYNGGTVFSIKPPGLLKVLYSFGGTQSDGLSPSAGLTALGGMLYGVTESGGSCGAGTVFSITVTGTERVLHSLCSTDGGEPQGGLIAVGGKLYGTAATLGETTENIGGTVFEIAPNGKFHVVYSFHAKKGDGFSPSGNLAVIKDVLYGTTMYGGTACTAYPGCGTLYGVTTGGEEKVLYNFQGLDAGDGSQPEGGVTAVGGALYGTTFFGGENACHEGCGTAFRLTTHGTETTLYRFDAASNGRNPAAGVIAVDGILYGTTTLGGGGNCAGGCGTVYALAASGTETALHTFAGSPDGAGPESNLVEMNGKLYGVTISGGLARCRASLNAPDAGCGTIFRLER